MPPRVGEVAAWLKERGFVFHRAGKGDHGVYRNPETRETIVLDGAPSHELPMPVWRKLQKRFGWSDK